MVAAFAQSAFQAVGKLKCMIPIMSETYEVRLLSSVLRGVCNMPRSKGVLGGQPMQEGY